MGDGRHTPRSPGGEGKIGRVLARARKARGLSLEEAERATKIRQRYLVGLERGDYTVLPDAVYARGFLKAYADFLGLDGAGLSRGLGTRGKPRRERGPGHEPPKSGSGRPPVKPRGVPGGASRKEGRRASGPTVLTLVAVLAVAGLLGTFYFVGLNVRASSGGDPASAGRGESPGGQSGKTAPANDAPEPRAPEPGAPLDALRVGVKVEEEPVWIQVRSDSRVVFEEIARPGFARTFEARREVGIRAGYAGPISVEVNGQEVGPLGEPGEILDRSFTLKSAS